MKKVLGIALIAVLPVSILTTPAFAVAKAGAACSKAGLTSIVSGKKYTCVKSGNQLVWNKGTLIKKPTPITNSAVTPTPSPTAKNKTSDIQFFYSTSGCRNELGFLRTDELGKILSKKVIVKTNLNIQLIPEAYDSGQIIFSTYNCSNGESSLYNLNIGQKSFKPVELLKFQKGAQIIDAKWDVATDTALALVSYSAREYVVMTANVSRSVLWSSTAQGWGQKGIYPKVLISSTGREFTVFGENLLSGGWTSTQVNFGISSRGTETQYRGKGKLIDVVKSWLDAPYAVALDTGVYLCADFPTVSVFNNVQNIETSEFCNRVATTSPYSSGMLGFSLVASGVAGSSNEILINSSNSKGFTYKSLGLFGTGNKIKEFKEVPLNGVYFTYIVGSFELSFNIGDTAPDLTLQEGYFTQN